MKLVVLILLLLFVPFSLAVDQYNGNFVIEDTTNDVAQVKVIDSQIPFSSPFIGTGKFLVDRRDSNFIRLYSMDSVPTYALENINDPGAVGCGVSACNPAQSCSVSQEFISAVGALDGFDMINENMVLRYRADYDRLPGNAPATVNLKQEIFHVDANGESQLIQTVNRTVLLTPLNFESTFNIDTIWGEDDRIKNVLSFSFSCFGFAGGDENDNIWETLRRRYEDAISFAYENFITGFNIILGRNQI